MERQRILRFFILSLLLTSSLVTAHLTQALGELVLTLSAESQTVTKGGELTIIASLINNSGNAVTGQEITFTASLGTIYPTSVVTGNNGEASVIFLAGDETGISKITASTDGAVAAIDITVTEQSTAQWIVSVLLCILGILGAGSGTVLYLRRKKVQTAQDNNI
jgi:hypothetical protein